MIKHGKNYEEAERILSEITDNLTLWDIEILWCLVVIKRNDGHRLKSSKRLGVAYRTLRSYAHAAPRWALHTPTTEKLS